MAEPLELDVYDKEYKKVGTVSLEYPCTVCDGLGKVVDWETDLVSPCPSIESEEETCNQGMVMNDAGGALLAFLKRWAKS